jgi:large repetitive protein
MQFSSPRNMPGLLFFFCLPVRSYLTKEKLSKAFTCVQRQMKERSLPAFLIFVISLTMATAHAQSVTAFAPISQGMMNPPSMSVTVPNVGGTPVVVTQGNSNLDFTDSGGDSCSGSSCTVNVKFQPKSAGAHYGAIVTNGTVVQFLYGMSTGPVGVIIPGEINTIAGTGLPTFKRDNTPAIQAPIGLPQGEVVDAAGNLYISDSFNNRIRKVDTSGNITTYVGTGQPGSSGDNGPATSATITKPSGLVMDGAGNLYFADNGSNVIRMVDATPQHIITTIAGTAGNPGYNGPAFGTPGFNAPQPLAGMLLNQPNGLALDANQNLYVADSGNNIIRVIKLNATPMTITTIAGSLTAGFGGEGDVVSAAVFSEPWGVAFANSSSGGGFLYVADVNNNIVRKLDLTSGSGLSTTVAGAVSQTGSFNGDTQMPATQVALNNPEGVAVDLAGNIYIADTENHRIRKVNGQTGLISTIAGSTQGFAGDGQNSGAATQLNFPSTLVLDNSANLYIGDEFNNRVREISSGIAILSYGQIKNFQISSPQPETFENDGNATLTLQPFVFVNASLDSTTTSTCTSVTTLPLDQSCTLQVDFAPQVQNLPTGGATTPGTLTIPSDAANSPGTINLTGDVLTVNPTTTSVTSLPGPNPSALNASVTFTATVTNHGNGPLTGSVNFFDGATQIGCNASLPAGTVNSGTATLTCSTSLTTLGKHNITAIYAGDLNNAPSPTSPTFVQTVESGTLLALTSNVNPVSTPNFPASIIFTATLTQAFNPGAAVITFTDGQTVIGTGTLTAIATGGTVTFPISTLAPGPHSIVASYPSDSNNLAATSNSLSITINATPTTTTLSPSNSANPTATFGTSFTFQASVTNGSNAVPTGTVTFSDNNGVSTHTTTLPLVNGVATFPATLSTGTHSITASYSGDTDNAASSSAPPTTFVVTPIGTTIAVTGTSPANAGASVNLTATVSGATAAGGLLTGSVTFFDGGTPTSGQLQLSASGTATLTTTTLAPGMPSATHSITATYTGTANSGNANSNYGTSTSQPFSQVVTQNTPKVVLSSSSSGNPSIAGTFVTLTAAVNGTAGTPTPTGTVTFSSNGTPLSTVAVNASGQATLMLSNLPAGSDSIVATYSGDTDNIGAPSQNLVQVVNKATTSVIVTASPASPIFGAPITLTANLTGTGGTLTGTITFEDGGTPIGTANVNGSSPLIATFSPTSQAVGSHTITTIYSGDTNNSPSNPSPAITVAVQQITTSTALTSSANPGVLNQSLTLTANVSDTSGNIAPGGTVSFQDSGTVIGIAPLTGGVASLPIATLSLGGHSIIAVYSGDTNHSASQSRVLKQQILQPASIALISGVNPSTAEIPVIFTAKLTGVQGLVPTGTVTFRDGATILGVIPADTTGTATFSISSLAVGSHSIVAAYSGDTNYQPLNSAVLQQTVQIANTSVTLTSSANPATANTSLTFTAAVKGTGGATTGSVTFRDGTTVLGNSAVNAGVATFSMTSLSPGQHSVTAVYSGDSNNSPNTSAILQQQVQQLTVASLASSANPSLTLSSIVLTCTITNRGTQPATGLVTFTDGSSTLGSAPLNASGVATLNLPSLAVGQHSIIASYGGDVADFPSTSAPFAQVVQLRATTDVLTATATSLTGGQQLTLISVVRWTGPVAPTGSVVFTIGNTVIGTSPVDSIGVATLTIILDPGAATIVASYSGDSVYSASQSPATPISDGPPTSFTMQASSTSIALVSKQNTTINLTLTSLNGFSDTLSLGCLGLPFAATCTFTANQPNLTSNGAQTVHLVIDTGSPLTSGSATVAANHSTESISSRTALCFLPCGALLGWLLMKSRRRRPLTGLLLVLCCLGLAIGISGCGSLDQSGTPPGVYTFKITASGLKTGVTQSTDMTLTVTQQ